MAKTDLETLIRETWVRAAIDRADPLLADKISRELLVRIDTYGGLVEALRESIQDEEAERTRLQLEHGEAYAILEKMLPGPRAGGSERIKAIKAIRRAPGMEAASLSEARDFVDKYLDSRGITR